MLENEEDFLASCPEGGKGQKTEICLKAYTDVSNKACDSIEGLSLKYFDAVLSGACNGNGETSSGKPIGSNGEGCVKDNCTLEDFKQYIQFEYLDCEVTSISFVENTPARPLLRPGSLTTSSSVSLRTSYVNGLYIVQVLALFLI